MGRDALSLHQKLVMERLGQVVFVAEGLDGAASHRKLLSQCAGRLGAPVALQTPGWFG